MCLATVVLQGLAGFGCTHLAVVNHANMRCWCDKPLADVYVLTVGKPHHLRTPSQMLQQRIVEYSMVKNRQVVRANGQVHDVNSQWLYLDVA